MVAKELHLLEGVVILPINLNSKPRQVGHGSTVYRSPHKMHLRCGDTHVARLVAAGEEREEHWVPATDEGPHSKGRWDEEKHEVQTRRSRR